MYTATLIIKSNEKTYYGMKYYEKEELSFSALTEDEALAKAYHFYRLHNNEIIEITLEEN